MIICLWICCIFAELLIPTISEISGYYTLIAFINYLIVYFIAYYLLIKVLDREADLFIKSDY